MKQNDQPSLTDAQIMRCVECKSVDTELICFIGKDGKVYMKVECNKHGGHSHMIRRGEVHFAIERMLFRLSPVTTKE